MPIKPWTILKSKYLVKDRYMTLRMDTCKSADGKLIDPYYVQEIEDWVHVVAFDDEERILIIEQYRHGAGIISIEIPCGAIEKSETPVQAITRELLEETGCTYERLEPLPVVSPNPARYQNRIHSFIAYGAKQIADQNLDETEEIDFKFLPIPEVLHLIHTGQFVHTLNISSIMLALEKIGYLQAAK